MKTPVRSIRPFLGAKDFERSRSFYRELGFAEHVIGASLSVFSLGVVGFYLQNGYVKDWVDNSMIFVEVADVDAFWAELVALELPAKYAGVRVTPIRTYDWGRECFVHDPSGILWHFGQFTS
jgi:catechol 2,3-dioxygenase-like lactoylglutathione lyase family enzyme